MEVYSFQSELGAMALALCKGRIAGLVFGRTSESAARRDLKKIISPEAFAMADQGGEDAAGEELIERLQAFAAGEAVDFSDVSIDSSYATPFQKRVLAACRKIGWGETITYGELAARAGRPGAARAVGSVMAGNRVPLIVPCHRVVPAGSGLGGFSAPQGVKMKRRLLDAEQCLVGCR